MSQKQQQQQQKRARTVAIEKRFFFFLLVCQTGVELVVDFFVCFFFGLLCVCRGRCFGGTHCRFLWGQYHTLSLSTSLGTAALCVCRDRYFGGTVDIVPGLLCSLLVRPVGLVTCTVATTTTTTTTTANVGPNAENFPKKLPKGFCRV